MLKEECGEANEKDREERVVLEQELENVEEFLGKFSGFQKELAAKVEYAKAELEELTKQVKELIKAYGLDANDVPPKEFFEIFCNFSKEFT